MRKPNIFRTYRQMLGMSQEELAALVGVSQEHISRIEHESPEVSKETLAHVAALLGIPAEEIGKEEEKGK